jgi:glycosyltransferase involved in cell wall biosynthesis
MGAPFFSICTPVYNGEPFLEEMIETMFSQKFQDWEWIILNDASTDRSWEIIKRRVGDDPRVRLRENPRNLGQGESLTRVIREARGTWVGILPADDGYRAHTLQTVHDYVAGREDLLLWTHSRLAVGQGKVPDVILIRNHVTEWTAGELADTLFLTRNVFGGLANYFYRRSVVEEAQLAFVGPEARVDTFFWIRLLKSRPEMRTVYHPDVLSFVTAHPASGSARSGTTGQYAVALFDMPLDLLALDWSFRTRLLQLARLLKCWLRFGRHLPPGQRGLPWRAVRAYFGSLFRGDLAASRP